MSTTTISLYALAAMVGIAPAMLRSTLTRAGVRLLPNDRASERDLARVFGVTAAREFVERAQTRRRPNRTGDREEPDEPTS